MPGRVDAAVQSDVRYETAFPNSFDHFVSADNAITVTDEIEDEIEHLRLGMHQGRATAQLTAVCV
jgi:hypothetical protein